MHKSLKVYDVSKVLSFSKPNCPVYKGKQPYWPGKSEYYRTHDIKFNAIVNPRIQ